MPQEKPSSVSFTTYHKSLSSVLRNEIQVSQAFHPEKAQDKVRVAVAPHKFWAIWDTGATNSVITENVINRCNLQPIGMARVHTPQGEFNTERFLVNIYLPNKLLIHTVSVTKGILDKNNDVLIGMDIIAKGDFAVTNKNNQTIFSFRYPSLEHIDFVKTHTSIYPIKRREKIGRNEPCPCGSGKKCKKCCGTGM